MKKINLGEYLLWKGKPAKAIYETSERTVGIELLEESKCPHCGGNIGKEQINIIPTSPLFQENAEPLRTIKND